MAASAGKLDHADVSLWLSSDGRTETDRAPIRVNDALAGATGAAAPSKPAGKAGPKPWYHGDSIMGLLLVLLSTVTFSVMSYAVNEIGPEVPVLQTASIRFWAQGFFTLCTIPIARRGKGLDKPETWLGKPENRWKLMMRGGWGIFGLSCFFATLQSLNLADATAIVYVNIPLTAFFASLILKEPFTRVDVATAVLAFVGVLFVAQPPAIFGGTAAPVPLPSLAIALFGSCCSAMAYVSIRIIGKSEDSLVIVFWFSILGSICVPALCLVLQRFIPFPSPRVMVLEVITGLFGWAGQVFLNAGMQRAPIGPSAAMRYADILWSILFQAVIQGKPPNGYKYLGCALIMSTLASTIYKSRQKHMAERKKEAEEARAAEIGSDTAVEAAVSSARAGMAADSDAGLAGAAHSAAPADGAQDWDAPLKPTRSAGR